MHIRSLALLAALLAGTTATASESLDYTFFLSDRDIGWYRVEQIGVDSWRAQLHADDNGRGARFTAEYRLDNSGNPVAVDIEGLSWFHAQVREHFERDDGTARWRTHVDEGEVKDSGAFYFSTAQLPIDYVLLSRLLRNAPGNRLALLPAGEARGEILHSVELDGQRYELHAVHGLWTDPHLHWLDEHGRLAAWLSGMAFGIVRNDLRDLVPRFTELQQSITDARDAERIRRFREPASGKVVFRDVAVFDSVNAERVAGRDVLVDDGRIVHVRPTGGTLPDGARIIEGKGATLLPGLWDVHAHTYDPTDGFLHIAFGVTSVRQMGNDPAAVLALRNSIAAGELIGPRLYLAGFIEGTSETNSNVGRLAGSLDEALAHVDWYAANGFRQIKIYNSIRPEWVRPMVDRAHEHGMRVSGHVPAFMLAEDAVRAGYDEINHINMLLLNFLLEEGDDTRTLLRFTRMGERAGTLDLGSRKVREFIAEMKKREVAVDPTLAVFLSMMLARPGQLDPVDAFMLERMPATWQRDAYKPFIAVPAEQDANYRAAAVTMRKLLKLLHDEGIVIMPGTDGAPGYDLHTELVEWQRAGIPAAEVLRYATFIPAREFGLADERGSIAPGKLADLVLVDGDPTQRIEDLRRIRLVMQGKRLFDAPAMLEAVSIRP